ncbi:unnamed protein product [Owenia fusiformis]|uniref:NADH dehydrogenase [ubiquinone] iron-sulfur protein 5 n=1 Tax=Owenia fusiformis TaxID=6347 RepID=A0A8S4N2U9_OWEFU|nr:unnamed protein product [Owenia fusiformis]
MGQTAYWNERNESVFQNLFEELESELQIFLKKMSVPPIFDTPFTRITEHWLSHQHSECAFLEKDFNRCAATIGVQRAQKECMREYQDFYECATKMKQQERHWIMQAVRKEKGLPYKPAPPPDSWNFSQYAPHTAPKITAAKT